MRGLCYVGAYIIAIGGGWALVGLAMHLMRKTVGISRAAFKWIDFWMGGTERAVAVTLVLFAPSYLPAFIGGWVGLKFAANWKRHEKSAGIDIGVTHGSLLSLIGSVLSFSCAIAVAIFIHPEALQVWAK